VNDCSPRRGIFSLVLLFGRCVGKTVLCLGLRCLFLYLFHDSRHGGHVFLYFDLCSDNCLASRITLFSPACVRWSQASRAGAPVDRYPESVADWSTTASVNSGWLQINNRFVCCCCCTMCRKLKSHSLLDWSAGARRRVVKEAKKVWGCFMFLTSTGRLSIGTIFPTFIIIIIIIIIYNRVYRHLRVYLGLINFTSASARWPIYRRSVTD